MMNPKMSEKEKKESRYCWTLLCKRKHIDFRVIYFNFLAHSTNPLLFCILLLCVIDPDGCSPSPFSPIQLSPLFYSRLLIPTTRQSNRANFYIFRSYTHTHSCMNFLSLTRLHAHWLSGENFTAIPQ